MKNLYKSCLQLSLFITVLFSYGKSAARELPPVRLKTGDIRLSAGSALTNNSKPGLYLLQFNTVPDEAKRRKLESAGVFLHDYVPEMTWYATVQSGFNAAAAMQTGISAVSPLLPEWKTESSVYNGQFPDWSLSGKTVSLSLFIFRTNAFAEFETFCKTAGIKIEEYQPRFLNIQVTLDTSSVKALLAHAAVYWAEPGKAPVEAHNLPGRINHRALALNMPGPGGRNLWGKGVVIGEWDGAGIGSHVDYNDRLINKNPFVAGGGGNHATHVSGTITGGGIIDPFAQGMAPKASIFGWDFFGNIPAEMDTASFRDSIVMTNNSYGYSSDPCATRGTYDGISRNLDILVSMYPYLSHQFSSGNSRSNNCAAGGYRTINSGFQAAKNNLTIGALQWNDGNSSFHSYGPMRDGRMKPEICAVGVNVYSTMPNNSYQGGWNGTSMSCPGATGTIALLHERYKQLNSGKKPLAHTIKAIVCNTADDIGNAGPDYAFGFGRINAVSALQMMENQEFTVDSVTNASVWTDTITVASGTSRLQVFLAWDDVPASAGASPSLVNDLDLELVDNGGTVYRPWTLNPGCHTCLPVRKRDSLNNAEQAYIDNPSSGKWVIRVKGTLVTSANEVFTVSTMQIKPFVRVTYPNGHENMLPPTSTNPQTISWDAFGTSSTFTLEYSADSGVTWNSIATGISSATRFFTWNNAPAGLNTRKALVRVRNGSLTDISDTTFHIYWKSYQPSAVVCDRQIHLYWQKTPGAVRYRVLQSKNSYMEEIGITTDTFFTVFNLVNGSTYWFSLQAIGPNGETGPRTNGVSFVPQNTPVPPSVSLEPQSLTICEGNQLKLKSAASGTSPFSRQWQYSDDSGRTWKTMPGETEDSVLISNYLWQKRGYYYRNSYRNVCRNPVFTKAAIIDVDTPMVFSARLSDPWMCEGDSVEWNLTVASATVPVLQWQVSSNGGTNWTDLPGDTTGYLKLRNVRHSINGYRYRLLASNFCETNKSSDTALVRVTAPLRVSAPADTLICYGNPVNLNAVASGGDSTRYIFTWLNLPAGNPQSVKPLSRTVYYIKIDDQCSYNDATDSMVVNVRSALTISASRDTTLCQGRNAILSASLSGGLNSGYRYLWTPGNLTTSSINVNPSKTETYTLTATDGCTPDTFIRQIVVTRLDSLKLTGSNDTLICNGKEANLLVSATGGLSANRQVNWNQGLGTGNSKTVKPIINTAYFAVLTDACSVLPDTAFINVDVLAPLTLNLNNDTTICLGNSVQLNTLVSGGLVSARTVSWDNGLGTGFSKTVKPTLNTTYTAVLSDGCSADNDTQQIMVNVLGALALNIGSDTTICNGNSATLLAISSGGNGNHQVTWYDVSSPAIPLGTGSSLSINPLSNIQIRAVLADGCTVKNDSTTKRVTVLPALNLKLSPDTAICATQNARLRARTSGGKGTYQYSWTLVSSGAIAGNDSNLLVSPGADESYRVTVSDGCSSVSPAGTIRVQVVPMPVVSFTLNPSAVCEDETITLNNSSSGSRFLLDNRNYSGADTLLLLPAATHRIRMTAFNSLGCRDTGSRVAVVHANPVAGFTISPQNPREKDIVKISDVSSGGSSWNWALPHGVFSTQQVPDWTSNDTGIFTLFQQVSNAFGCTDTASITVRVGIGYFLHIPTAFTPDDNGLNDQWKPVVRGVSGYKLRIFNRWGEQVFETGNPDKGWDGKDAPTGAYAYTLSFITAYGQKVSEKGTFTIIR